MKAVELTREEVCEAIVEFVVRKNPAPRLFHHSVKLRADGSAEVFEHPLSEEEEQLAKSLEGEAARGFRVASRVVPG